MALELGSPRLAALSWGSGSAGRWRRPVRPPGGLGGQGWPGPVGRLKPLLLAMLPGALNAASGLPHPIAMATGAVLGLAVLGGIALVHVPGVDEGLAVLQQHQIEVQLADHFGHQAAVAVDGLGPELHGGAGPQPLLQVVPAGGTPGGLVELGGINAGKPHRALLATDPHLDRIAVADPQHRGLDRPFPCGGQAARRGGIRGPQGRAPYQGGRQQQPQAAHHEQGNQQGPGPGDPIHQHKGPQRLGRGAQYGPGRIRASGSASPQRMPSAKRIEVVAPHADEVGMAVKAFDPVGINAAAEAVVGGGAAQQGAPGHREITGWRSRPQQSGGSIPTGPSQATR